MRGCFWLFSLVWIFHLKGEIIMSYTMITYGFTVVGILIAAVSGYFWYRERGDRESVKIFRAVCVMAILITVLTFPVFIQKMADYVVTHYNNYSYFDIYNILVSIVGVYCVIHTVYMISRRGKPRKWFVILMDVAFVYIVLVTLLYSYQWAKTDAYVKEEGTKMQEEMLEKSQIVENYAKKCLREKFSVQEENILETGFGYPDTDSYLKGEKEGRIFQVAFSYCLSGKEEKEYYGYEIELDEENQCKILKENTSIGDDFFDDGNDNVSESEDGAILKNKNSEERFETQVLENAKEENGENFKENEEDTDMEEEDEEAMAVSIIGGADGPTSIFLVGKLGSTTSFILFGIVGVVVVVAVIGRIIILLRKKK